MRSLRGLILIAAVLITASLGAQTNPVAPPFAVDNASPDPDRKPRLRRATRRVPCIGYRNEVLPGIYEVNGLDVSLPYDDLAPLADIVGDAEVVALGESIHTSGGYYRAKHRLFRYLVEELGFRAFAFESPWTDAERVKEYVETCEGSSFEAVTEGLFGVWASQAVLDMVGWMCSYNQSHPDDPVAFWGFDIQQPWYDGGQLLGFLDDIGLDIPEIILGIERCNGVGFESPSEYYSTPGSRDVSEEDHLACLQALDMVETYFDVHEAELVASTSVEALSWARINVVALRARQGARYYSEREDFEASYQSRDQGMAEVFLAIKALRNPDDRVALWAHNWHIAYKGEVLEWFVGYRIMGNYLREALGDGYFALGLVGYRVSTNWPGQHVGELEPPSNELHIEYKLHHELGHNYLLVDLDFPGVDEPFLVGGAGYYLSWDWVIPAEQFGALFYLDTSEMMDALLW